MSAAVEFDCANHPGPQITFGPATITLGDVSGRFTFSNNLKLNTHVAESDVVVENEPLLVGEDAKIYIPKQPSRDADSLGGDLTGTGVGGNPWIYAQINDGKYILLGRCVQGAASIDTDLLDAILAAGIVHVDGDCYNHPGPFVSFSGDITLGSVTLTITFTNNKKFTHAAAGDFTASFDLIPGGFNIVLPKQPPLGGVGGNPHIWFQFLNDGEPVGTPPGYYLGRCVQDF